MSILSSLLVSLGQSDVELVAHGDRLRHRPSVLAPDLLMLLRMHKAAILALLANEYIADHFNDPEAAYILFERLGIADELRMPTHPGAPAWLIAVGESITYLNRFETSMVRHPERLDYDGMRHSEAPIDSRNPARGCGGASR